MVQRLFFYWIDTESRGAAVRCKHDPVILPATHDTASAVAAVPARGTSWAYISSGTWSLMGVEIPAPLTGEPVLAANFTNEGGVGAVEAALIGGLAAFGVPAAVAVPSVLLYRFLTCWLPVIVGWPVMRWLTTNNMI